MPTSVSIRASGAVTTYGAVIDNFRRAYNAKYNNTCEELTGQEILFCWEIGWSASDGEEEDQWALEEMRNMMLSKMDPT